MRKWRCWGISSAASSQTAKTEAGGGGNPEGTDAAAGDAELYGEEDQPLGRQAQVWMKISFCCPSGEECWRLWERCAQRLLFSDKLGAEQIECGEAVWQKESCITCREQIQYRLQEPKTRLF